MAKPKRTARPGGAPLAKPKGKRPCKYGPRVDGLCPKAPRATTRKPPSGGQSPRKGKPPCKYGARLANGRCPKRDTIKSVRELPAAIGRDLDRKVAKETRQASRAVATATEKAIEKAAEPYLKRAAEKAKGALPFLATWSLPVAAALVGGYLGATAQSGFEREQVARMLMDTEKGMGRPLTEKERALLAPQYLQFVRQKERARQRVERRK